MPSTVEQKKDKAGSVVKAISPAILQRTRAGQTEGRRLTDEHTGHRAAPGAAPPSTHRAQVCHKRD